MEVSTHSQCVSRLTILLRRIVSLQLFRISFLSKNSVFLSIFLCNLAQNTDNIDIVIFRVICLNNYFTI